MRRIAYRPYVLLIGFLFFILSFPFSATETLRSGVVRMFSPSWKAVHFVKSGFFNLFTVSSPQNVLRDKSFEIDRLSQENQILRTQIESVKEWLIFEERIQQQLHLLESFESREEDALHWKDFFKRRSAELSKALELQLQSIPAKVIFREPGSWSSSLWLNVGERDNEALKKTVIAKNSPVLSCGSIVGVVEYVGKSQSRVRLISDSGLVPSVRAVRGSEQNRFLLEHLEALMSGLQFREDLFESQEMAADLQQKFQNLKTNLKSLSSDSYLAKGELFGSSSALWRSRGQILHGVGFNYDYPDQEGPARDLRTGEPHDLIKKLSSVPILKVGDLLVTTGMDGVFPPGFQVAVVTKIGSLREGGASYELEAKACAGNLEEIKHVFVLPPIQ